LAPFTDFADPSSNIADQLGRSACEKPSPNRLNYQRSTLPTPSRGENLR